MINAEFMDFEAVNQDKYTSKEMNKVRLNYYTSLMLSLRRDKKKL